MNILFQESIYLFHFFNGFMSYKSSKKKRKLELFRKYILNEDQLERINFELGGTGSPVNNWENKINKII